MKHRRPARCQWAEIELVPVADGFVPGASSRQLLTRESGCATKEEGVAGARARTVVKLSVVCGEPSPFVAHRLKDDGFVPPVNEIVPDITRIAAFGPRWSNLRALQETCHERRYVE
jgi:hypothetical protein